MSPSMPLIVVRSLKMTSFIHFLTLIVGVSTLSPTASAQGSDPAFLVLAPDRGFLGNEEARDLMAAFQTLVPNSALAIATHEKTAENLSGPVGRLREGEEGREIVVLPLFMSTHEALYQAAVEVLAGDPAVVFAEPFGSDYLAEEVLFDQIRPHVGDGHQAGHGAAHSEGHGAAHGEGHGASPRPYLILLADGAESEEDAAGIRSDLEPRVRHAVDQFGLEGGEIAVLHSRRSQEGGEAFSRTVDGIRQAAGEHEQIILIPFNFGLRLTTMMSHWNWVTMGLHDAPNVVGGEPDATTAHPNVERWLVRTAHAYSPLTRDDVGVIFVPHGSDYNWNEMMREGLAPLRDEYVTEDAFSMVDPYVVERAVRRLEDRGLKAAVVLRIFSLESSFKDQSEYVLGLRGDPPAGGHMGTPDRIESHLLFHTLGGVEAHPRFSKAIIDRIHEISTDPANETVILLAHGTGDDADNDHWMHNLNSIADYIRQNDPNTYRDIKYHTWREDWPEKRAVTIPEIRAMIEEAGESGGTPLVIPIRTNEQGPARSLVPDLSFRYGYGFAPHPEFTEWAREQIEEGIGILMDPSRRRSPSVSHDHHRR